MHLRIHDELPPESNAMLQALYSRSSSSVDSHFQRVVERGPDDFMASYYVGYGHASIGDCAYTTIYIEDISLLACKAVQDNVLYSGQETSTRYIDFSRRAVIDPIATEESNAIVDRWMKFYVSAEPVLYEHLLGRFTRPSGKTDASWRKAVSARCFDILRGFLPAGVTSQVAWTTSFRQAHDNTLRLMAHPLEEVRAIGSACRQALQERYPRSFGHDVPPETMQYLQDVGEAETYMEPFVSDGFSCRSSIDNASLERECLSAVTERPRRQPLPKSLARFGNITCRFSLDFGSFRDLQRHRGGICRMPLLTDRLGFHQWYLDQLPDSLRLEATRVIEEQRLSVSHLRECGISDKLIQYLQPLGMRVACEIIYDLPQMVYVAELRSGQTTHPTLRAVAQAMAAVVKQQHPRVAIFDDESPDSLCVKRGDQDIIDLRAAKVGIDQTRSA